MSEHLTDEDWIANKKFVLDHLDRLHSDLQTLSDRRITDKEDIRKEIQQLGEKLTSSQERLSRDITVLKTKAAFWGAGASFVVSACVGILLNLM